MINNNSCQANRKLVFYNQHIIRQQIQYVPRDHLIFKPYLVSTPLEIIFPPASLISQKNIPIYTKLNRHGQNTPKNQAKEVLEKVGQHNMQRNQTNDRVHTISEDKQKSIIQKVPNPNQKSQISPIKCEEVIKDQIKIKQDKSYEVQKCPICSTQILDSTYSKHLQFHKNRINYKDTRIPLLKAPLHDIRNKREKNDTQLMNQLIDFVIENNIYPKFTTPPVETVDPVPLPLISPTPKPVEEVPPSVITPQLQNTRQNSFRQNQVNSKLEEEKTIPQKIKVNKKFLKTRRQKKDSLNFYSNIKQLQFTYNKQHQTQLKELEQNK